MKPVKMMYQCGKCKKIHPYCWKAMKCCEGGEVPQAEHSPHHKGEDKVSKGEPDGTPKPEKKHTLTIKSVRIIDTPEKFMDELFGKPKKKIRSRL